MTEEELENLKKVSAFVPTITINDLEHKTSRTLIYGYDVNRNTIHLYIKTCQFFYVIYDSSKNIIFSKKMNIIYIKDRECEFVPNKRVYYERSDYEFCKLLTKHGVHISFTDSRGNVEPQQYYGCLLEELNKGINQ